MELTNNQLCHLRDIDELQKIATLQKSTNITTAGAGTGNGVGGGSGKSTEIGALDGANNTAENSVSTGAGNGIAPVSGNSAENGAGPGAGSNAENGTGNGMGNGTGPDAGNGTGNGAAAPQLVRVEYKVDARFIADNDVVLTTYELLRTKPMIFKKVRPAGGGGMIFVACGFRPVLMEGQYFQKC